MFETTAVHTRWGQVSKTKTNTRGPLKRQYMVVRRPGSMPRLEMSSYGRRSEICTGRSKIKSEKARGGKEDIWLVIPMAEGATGFSLLV
jgi:hypothetical protein